MAQFTRVNGDYKQVLWLDAPDYTNTGVNAVTSAVTVQPQGPKLDFFTLTGNGSQIADNIQAAFQTIQQLATIHIYEYTDDAADLLAVALYPVGAYTAASLETQLLALGGGFAGGAVANGAEFGA